tara:strand:- start:92462 stop:94411 length:1950 start_codon:yes stop_codon:yes gene_type:complete
MNSYNESLHTSVLLSLSKQELQLQKKKGTLDASMFSLYYAEGARITAAEELQAANNNYAFQQLILEQAVIDSNISTNTLVSTNLGNQFVSQSVKNTSVAAANVQIAANAILKLASDVGSIFSIVNAADFETEIYAQSEEAYKLMNETAYLAERTSQLSMEASGQIAEVPITSLVNKADSTDASIKSLLDIATTDFKAASESVIADSEALGAANTQEKAAEGILENTDSVFNSSLEAYKLTCLELNLNLKTTLPYTVGNATDFTVSFNRYRSPFDYKNGFKGVSSKVLNSGYPVNDYYIFLVKNSKKEIFSISDAEGLVLEGEKEKKYLKIESTNQNTYSEKIYMSDLKDSNGQDIKLGERYVVFVFAVLNNEYKKIINTFEDYLSAPSAFFTLKNKLTAPKHDDISVSDNIMTFNVDENPDYNVEYRCIFLPNNKKLVRGLLTAEGLKSIEGQTEHLDEIFSKYNPEIERLEAEINTLLSSESGLIAQKENSKEKQSQEGLEAKELKNLKEEHKKINETHINVQKEIRILNRRLEKVKKEKLEAVMSVDHPKHIKPGFFFNYTIATGLEIDSYIIAEKVIGSDEKTSYQVSIDSFTTDNFGNSLIPDNLYIPVVLAMSAEGEAVSLQFKGALSDFQNTDDFTYIKKIIN